MSILSAVGLTKRFSGLYAVRDVDLSVEPGEIRALIGPNGAGKTTLVSMLAGRLKPTAGAVVFDGVDVSSLAAHRRSQLGIAYTFQITSVFNSLPLLENVAIAARKSVLTGERDVEARALACLETVGLREPPRTPAGSLSYGHQRMLEIAMGLAQRPRLLILDEPTQGLAESEIFDFKRLVRQLAGEVTILLIEHNMSVVMDLADRVTVLVNGSVLSEGSPEVIRADDAVQQAYLGRGDA